MFNIATVDDIRADIRRVSRKIGDQSAEKWFQKTYGTSVSGYIAKQTRRMNDMMKKSSSGSSKKSRDRSRDDDERRTSSRSRKTSRDNRSSRSTRGMENIFDQLTSSMKEYLMPYEQMYRDVLANAPRYEMPSESELRNQAGDWADLQVNPLLQAIDRSLVDARASADKQRGEIQANYAGFEDTLNRMLSEAGGMATESAIARGGGRSGAVEWLTDKMQTPIMEQATTEQAKKTAALTALADAVALAEQQAGDKREQLEDRRGTLTANRLAELTNQAQAMSAADWQRAMGATGNLMNMATQAGQFGQNFAANLLPYFVPSVGEDMNYNLGLSEAFGEVADGLSSAPASRAPVSLRNYAAQRGASIGYDPATKQVTIGGKEYSPDKLKELGGYLQGGSWYIPESALAALM